MPKETKSNQEPRPPVIAILGHIDHGKSSLIDYIRKTNVVEHEAGGITQHASSYEITHTTKEGKSNQITILDTPGHEAFDSIRRRCANAADIGILIVSGEDGVKPQTLEVIKYLNESKLPFIVAITKIDKASSDVNRTKQTLAENGVYVEGFGGSTSVVEVSSKTGQGVNELLDLVVLTAELEGKTGDREALGSGLIIETRHDTKRGIIATGIIKNGTIETGLYAASGTSVTPIRFMLNANGDMVEKLSFSSPVQIVGWDKMPEIGSEFKTFLKKDEAVKYTEIEKAKEKDSKKVEAGNEDMTNLSIVLKADAAGSLEAIKNELDKISRERIKIKLISSGIGVINENDVKSALSTANSLVVGFNIKVDSQAASLAERSAIEILNFNIIYELTDKVKSLLEEKEPRIEVEEITGVIKVLKIFNTNKGKQVLGGRVNSGIVKKNAQLKIVRREIELGRAKIKELQQSKIDTDSVNEGQEFGAMIESKIEVAPGDILNAVTTVVK